MYSRDILKIINFIYHEQKITKYDNVSSNLYVFDCLLNEILTRRKPNIMIFSITST